MSVHVWYVGLHFRLLCNAACVPGRFLSHPACHPLPAISGCAPAPAAGGVPSYCCTYSTESSHRHLVRIQVKVRYRHVVLWLLVCYRRWRTASVPLSLRPIGNVPPGTRMFWQQLLPWHSVPLIPAHDGPSRRDASAPACPDFLRLPPCLPVPSGSCRTTSSAGARVGQYLHSGSLGSVHCGTGLGTHSPSALHVDSGSHGTPSQIA